MEILNQAMEFTQQYSLFFLAGMFVVILILVICMTVMNSRMKELQSAYDDFMRGSDGKSLEGILKTIVEDNKRVKIQCKRDIDEIISMKKGLKATYKKIGIMKYDTFRGMAGKLSFSLALLDGDDSGFILSSMHTQDGCYSYLKEIIHGESHATLSNEERDALTMALNYNVDAAKLEEKQAQQMQQATPVQQDNDEQSN